VKEIIEEFTGRRRNVSETATPRKGISPGRATRHPRRSRHPQFEQLEVVR